MVDILSQLDGIVIDEQMENNNINNNNKENNKNKKKKNNKTNKKNNDNFVIFEDLIPSTTLDMTGRWGVFPEEVKLNDIDHFLTVGKMNGTTKPKMRNPRITIVSGHCNEYTDHLGKRLEFDVDWDWLNNTNNNINSQNEDSEEGEKGEETTSRKKGKKKKKKRAKE
jgi:hypothetical protein